MLGEGAKILGVDLLGGEEEGGDTFGPDAGDIDGGFDNLTLDWGRDREEVIGDVVFLVGENGQGGGERGE